MENALLFCSILMKIKFSRQIFKKCSYIKLHEKTSSGSRVFPCGRTNSHDEVVRNFANASKNRCKREQWVPDATWHAPDATWHVPDATWHVVFMTNWPTWLSLSRVFQTVICSLAYSDRGMHLHGKAVTFLNILRGWGVKNRAFYSGHPAEYSEWSQVRHFSVPPDEFPLYLKYFSARLSLPFEIIND